jgi:hypothetical protein
MATTGSAAHRSDISELERLKNLAERDSVKALLDTVIAKSQKLLERAEDSEKQEALKVQERQRLEEARKKREAEMEAQGKVMPQPIGREKVMCCFFEFSSSHPTCIYEVCLRLMVFSTG